MKARPFVVPTLLVSATMLAMSGACSQHDPGPYQGGGRGIPTSVIGPVSGGGGPDGALPDISIPDSFVVPDNFVQPDTAGGQ
jgi:hypothetical protein